MIHLNNLSTITGYDFDSLTKITDMSNKLFLTFSQKEDISNVVESILNRYVVEYNKIFVLECTDQEEVVITYNVDLNNVSDFLDNTILVHRKKQSNTLYTINALNELIKTLNNGILDKRFMVNWNDYRNSILLTKEGQLEIIKTKLFEIIEV